MLLHTLILPESDSRLAVRMLRDAIETLDIVLMLVFGRDERATEIVGWADQLCNKTATPDGNLRAVVWIRDVSTASMSNALKEIIPQEVPRVAVLNFFDTLMGSLKETDEIDPVELEILFLKGHQT